MLLANDVQYLKGVGPRKAKLLEKIGIKTVYDLITYFPVNYEDRRFLKPISQVLNGEEISIQAKVIRHQIVYTRKKNILKIYLSDKTGEAALLCFNQLYLADILKEGVEVIVHGKFEWKFLELEITNFVYEVLPDSDEDLIHTKRIVPMYGLTKGLNIKFLRSLIKKTLDNYADNLSDPLPNVIKEEMNFCDYLNAIKTIHFPKNWEDKEKAYKRLVFDEFFFFQLALALRKKGIKKEKKAFSYTLSRTLLSPFKNVLPFDFTHAQKKVINEIFADMQNVYPMNRLLQGDVGSGKTIVALSALLLAVENNLQGVIMVPTEILAEQHYMNLERMLSFLKVKVGLLTGGMRVREKEKIYQQLEKGEIDILIGTHTLLQEGVKFYKLGLVVIDEQHKFGVTQRSMLREKGLNPDVLVMTATPIPRTLALTVYGDLDVSTISEVPSGRGEILTLRIKEKDAYSKVWEEIKKGRQAYIVYPLVDEKDTLELKAAVKMAEKFKKEIFAGCNVGLLHGQMKKEQKKTVMENFLNKKLDILVATSIIEVGIDVGNASIMLIEHSERFGLSTLHQLRGRIGRGKYTSYCILLGNPKTPDSQERMKIMLSTNDGFEIAEKDLQLRGPGEFFGTQQHGMPELKIGNIIADFAILKKAREFAFKVTGQESFKLTDRERGVLKGELVRRFDKGLKLISVG